MQKCFLLPLQQKTVLIVAIFLFGIICTQCRLLLSIHDTFLKGGTKSFYGNFCGWGGKNSKQENSQFWVDKGRNSANSKLSFPDEGNIAVLRGR